MTNFSIIEPNTIFSQLEVISAVSSLIRTVNKTGTLEENVRAQNLKHNSSVLVTKPKLADDKMAALISSKDDVVETFPLFSFIPVNLSVQETNMI